MNQWIYVHNFLVLNNIYIYNYYSPTSYRSIQILSLIHRTDCELSQAKVTHSRQRMGDSGANIVSEEREADMTEVTITKVTDMGIDMDTEAIVTVVNIIGEVEVDLGWGNWQQCQRQSLV